VRVAFDGLGTQTLSIVTVILAQISAVKRKEKRTMARHRMCDNTQILQMAASTQTNVSMMIVSIIPTCSVEMIIPDKLHFSNNCYFFLFVVIKEY